MEAYGTRCISKCTSVSKLAISYLCAIDLSVPLHLHWLNLGDECYVVVVVAVAHVV